MKNMKQLYCVICGKYRYIFKNIKGGRINLDIKKSWFNWKYIII